MATSALMVATSFPTVGCEPVNPLLPNLRAVLVIWLALVLFVAPFWN